jgi:hypothetical protein
MGSHLPGQDITQQQRNLYTKSCQSNLTQQASAVKAEISVRYGRLIEKQPNPVKKQRHWRTRKDTLAYVAVFYTVCPG